MKGRKAWLKFSERICGGEGTRDLSETHAFRGSPDLTHPLQQDASITFRAMKYILIKSSKVVLNQLKINANIRTAPLRSGKKKSLKTSTMTFFLNIYLSVECAGLCQCSSTHRCVWRSEDTLRTSLPTLCKSWGLDSGGQTGGMRLYLLIHHCSPCSTILLQGL